MLGSSSSLLVAGRCGHIIDVAEMVLNTGARKKTEKKNLLDGSAVGKSRGMSCDIPLLIPSRQADQLHCERLNSSPSGVLGPLSSLLVAGCCGHIIDVAEMVLNTGARKKTEKKNLLDGSAG